MPPTCPALSSSVWSYTDASSLRRRTHPPAFGGQRPLFFLFLLCVCVCVFVFFFFISRDLFFGEMDVIFIISWRPPRFVSSFFLVSDARILEIRCRNGQLDTPKTCGWVCLGSFVGPERFREPGKVVTGSQGWFGDLKG